ncbi:unnamed protein product [Symbiodinium sp. CCMP2592]|nr:unnamed protein product [Symbiodinium sp. CCMP2592]
MPPPMTRHRRWVRQQLETWECLGAQHERYSARNWPDSVHLVFVRKLVEELSEQLDVAQDASSRQILSLHETQYAGCTTSPMLANCTGMLARLWGACSVFSQADEETVVVKDGELAIDAPLFLPCGTTLSGDLRASDKTQRPACDMELLPEQCHLKVRRHEGCPVAASTPRAGTTESQEPNPQSDTEPLSCAGSTCLAGENLTKSTAVDTTHAIHGPALLDYFSAARLQCQIPAKRGQEHVAKGLIVLLRHVAELGRFDTPSDAVVAFSDGVDRILSDSEPFPDDVERKKRFDCLLIDESNVKARFLPLGDPSSYSPQSRLVFISGQDWCVMLARTSTTHFSEDYVRQTVGNNLADLLTHCLDSDEGVRAAAHHIIQEHALGALGFVKELIADTVLRQMTDILSTGRETQTTWRLMAPYMAHLEPLLRWLTKSQRQDWASLLVNFLHSLQSTSAQTRATYQKLAVGHLKLLCFADDDASRTYADERRQLLALSDSPDFAEVKSSMASLFRC